MEVTIPAPGESMYTQKPLGHIIVVLSDGFGNKKLFYFMFSIGSAPFTILDIVKW